MLSFAVCSESKSENSILCQFCNYRVHKRLYIKFWTLWEQGNRHSRGFLQHRIKWSITQSCRVKSICSRCQVFLLIDNVSNLPEVLWSINSIWICYYTVLFFPFPYLLQEAYDDGKQYMMEPSTCLKNSCWKC